MECRLWALLYFILVGALLKTATNICRWLNSRIPIDYAAICGSLSPQRSTTKTGPRRSAKRDPWSASEAMSIQRRSTSKHLYAISSTNLGVEYSLRAKLSQILQYRRSWSTRKWFKIHHINISLLTRSIIENESSTLRVRPSTSSFLQPHLSSTQSLVSDSL